MIRFVAGMERTPTGFLGVGEVQVWPGRKWVVWVEVSECWDWELREWVVGLEMGRVRMRSGGREMIGGEVEVDGRSSGSEYGRVRV